MKICPNCKNSLEDDIKMCPNCNCFISNANVLSRQSTNSTEGNSSNTLNNQSEKIISTKKRKLFYALSWIGLIISIGCLICALYLLPNSPLIKGKGELIAGGYFDSLFNMLEYSFKSFLPNYFNILGITVNLIAMKCNSKINSKAYNIAKTGLIFNIISIVISLCGCVPLD